MNRFYLSCLFCISVILSAIIAFSFTVDRIFPHIQYNNTVEFDLAYLNIDEKLLIAFKERNAQIHDINRIDIPSSSVLNHISLQFPFVYSPSFHMIFGESNPVTFAISNLSVNGTVVSSHKVKKLCDSIGYITKEKQGVVYAQPRDDTPIGSFDVYAVSDSFINIEQEELNKDLDEESTLRLLYLVFLILVTFIIIKFVLLRYFNGLRAFHYVVLGIVLYSFLVCSAIILPYGDLSTYKIIELVCVLKNNLFLIVVPICFYILALYFKRSLFTGSVFVISLLMFLCVGVDHFANVVFGSRFIFDTVGKFAGTIWDGFPFFISYIKSYSGCLYILAGILLVALFSSLFNNLEINISRKSALICTFSCVSSLAVLFWGNYNEYSKYYNTFQVNINGLFTEGDYKRPYVHYTAYSYGEMGYEKYKGLNQRKNVILILVESLACDMTFLCGHQNNYSPYTQQLAKDNVWFPNYYSNNFHTNGAIFTITTGLPLVNGPHGEDSFFNKDLYTNDLVNRFRNEGYTVAYYTPANLVLNKKQQLEVSNYSYISSVDDLYYKGMDKTGVFGSVFDEKMFDKIIKDFKKDSTPKFYMLTTVSTHTPYITPWGSRNIEQSYKYTDYALKQFLKKLKDENYFDNGIVIVTGDHKGWGNNSQKHEDTYNIESQKVPLILINGIDHGVIIDDVSFSHSSLGIMLEYMMLSSYYKNKFQINPLADRGKDEVILHYNTNRVNNVLVKKGNKEDQILLDGDQTRFLGKSVFLEDEQNEILGFLTWIRQ